MWKEYMSFYMRYILLVYRIRMCDNVWNVCAYMK